MNFDRYTWISAAFALVLSIATVIVAGYYESPGLLVFQLLLIVAPTFGPFLLLPRSGMLGIISWLVIAALLTAGWSYVAYLDTRPYQGGGATLAPLFGWFTCFVGFLLAVTVKVLHSQFGKR